MRLDLDDGYTLKGETKPEAGLDPVTGAYKWTSLPVVHFEYRPALPEALMEYRYKYNRAASGREQLDILTVMVGGHLVSWDVHLGGQVAEIHLSTLRRVPEPILDQMLMAICTWAPKAGDARGNS
jgi:hypothetical protein